MIWTRTETLNSYIPGSMQILLIQSKIRHIFHYQVNIILKLVVKFVTELVGIVHFFSIVTNFSVQANLGDNVFSLQIHLSSWYLRAAAGLISFCNMVTLRWSFKLWLSWKCFASSLLSGLFLMSQQCLEKHSESCSPVCLICKTLCLEHCAA